MPHPFFDVLKFPWYREEAKAFHVALYQGVPVPGRIVLVYQEAGGAVPLTPGQPPDLAWKEAIENLTTARCLRRLCDHVLANQQLSSVHAAVRALMDAPDLLEQRELTEGAAVFLDRKPLGRNSPENVLDFGPNRLIERDNMARRRRRYVPM